MTVPLSTTRVSCWRSPQILRPQVLSGPAIYPLSLRFNIESSFHWPTGAGLFHNKPRNAIIQVLHSRHKGSEFPIWQTQLSSPAYLVPAVILSPRLHPQVSSLGLFAQLIFLIQECLTSSSPPMKMLHLSQHPHQKLPPPWLD